eukprot:4607739-Prymnesium_polylepis.1
MPVGAFTGHCAWLWALGGGGCGVTGGGVYLTANRRETVFLTHGHGFCGIRKKRDAIKTGCDGACVGGTRRPITNCGACAQRGRRVRGRSGGRVRGATQSETGGISRIRKSATGSARVEAVCRVCVRLRVRAEPHLAPWSGFGPPWVLIT